MTEDIETVSQIDLSLTISHVIISVQISSVRKWSG